MEFKVKIEIEGNWHVMTWQELCEAISFGNDLTHCKKRLWTGLLDKNGKEIYEGDIIKSENQAGIYAVTIDNYHGFRFMLGCGQLTKADAIYGEVIGNIYEHPHLLSSGEDLTTQTVSK